MHEPNIYTMHEPNIYLQNLMVVIVNYEYGRLNENLYSFKGVILSWDIYSRYFDI